MIRNHSIVSRRSVIAGAGALVVSFSSASRAFAQQKDDAQNAGQKPVNDPKLPGSLESAPNLDSWIRIDASGAVTVFTGKAELGQGIKTALLQVAAEQLDVPFKALQLVTADTHLTANEGFTAGSHSMQDSGTAIMHAAAQARALLIAEAARKFSLPPGQLRTRDGAVIAGSRSIGYGELVTAELLHARAQPQSELKPPSTFTVMDKDIQRVDIPAKVTGGAAYVQDMRLPGMVHARIVQPPSYGATLRDGDFGEIEHMPGVLKLVRNGSFLAVIAEREFQCVKAMRRLGALAQWNETARLPDQKHLADTISKLPAQDFPIQDKGDAFPETASVEATYTRPYQSHGSIGPSCAVAHFENGGLTVWTHTQGVFPDRDAIAEMVKLPADKVRCIHTEGSGCYGHNGADDVAADAALLAMALPGRPVRVQWMREQEHGWEPYGPAMVAKASATLGDGGRITNWKYEVWSNTHSMRPGGAGSLIAAQHLAEPFQQPAPKPLPQPEGGGDRNAIPLYDFSNSHVMHHFLPDMPIRVSALRALGAYMNVFAIESFMDEIATSAKQDPVALRLTHLQDQRARDVVTLAADKFGWSAFKRGPGRGRGFGFARYKNLAAYCAIAIEAEVSPDTGRVRVVRAVAAIDSGQAVNPNGLKNQVEGAIIQSISWTLFEQVTFDQSRITSVDWASYPILRFNSAPDSVDVHIIDRPGQPFLGSGETGQGPTAAAVANAVADATGHRVRDLPISRERIRSTLNL